MYCRTTWPNIKYSKTFEKLEVSSNFDKTGITEKIWEKAGLKVLRDLTVESVNFSALATADIKISLIFGEMDKRTKLVRLMKEKIIITEEKPRKMTLFNEKFSLSEPKLYPRIYGDCFPS